MAELLPHAFGPDEPRAVAGGRLPAVPARLASWRGRGTVFVHPDMRRRPAGLDRLLGPLRRAESGDEPGILEEAPTWDDPRTAVDWGRARTTRVVVVDADGQTYWAGEGEPRRGGRRGTVSGVRRTARGNAGRDAVARLANEGGLSGDVRGGRRHPHQARRGQRSPTRRSTGWSTRTPKGVVADEQMSALAMAILLRGMTGAEIARWTAAMIASGERLDLSARAPADRRQALHRRRRRQDHAAAHPAGRGLRRRRAAAVRPRPRAHRRHARQARVDPGLAGRR